MLLRKPTHAGGSPTPSSTRLFTELDGSVAALPSISPPPTSPQSKTHTFFSSSFSTGPPSPVLPPKKFVAEDRPGSAGIHDGRKESRPAPSRSLTADFFSASSYIAPPPKPVPSSSLKRNFLQLELDGVDESRLHASPMTLAAAFASTPTPTKDREEFMPEKLNTSTQALGSMDTTSEPTPRLPSVVFNQDRIQSTQQSVLNDGLDSAPSITNLGTEPDAEVLSTSPHFSHLSSLGLGGGLSAYPSRPTSSLSYHSAAPPDVNLSVTQAPAPSLDVLHPAGDEEELASGMIIRSFLPSSSHRTETSNVPPSPSLSPPPHPPISISAASSNSSSYTNSSTLGSSSSSSAPASASVPVALRLTRALGQGTFSSVWLAEDLSPTSLLLRSRKSLKDLKRKNTKELQRKKSSLSSSGSHGNNNNSSGVENQKGSERTSSSARSNGKLKSSLSTTSSLMRRLRGGVSGTRPGGASASSIKAYGSAPDSDSHSQSTQQPPLLPSGGIVMGRNGTLMPSPAPSTIETFSTSTSSPSASPSSNSHGLPLPPSLIPGHPSSSNPPKPASSRTLGLGMPTTMGPGAGDWTRRLSSGHQQSVYLEFSEEPSEYVASSTFSNSNSMSPPMSPNFHPASFGESLSIFGAGAHSQNQNQNHSQGQGQSQGQGASVSRASSISWRSSASSDEGHEGVGGTCESRDSNSNSKDDSRPSASASASRRSSTRSTRSSMRGRDKNKLMTRLVAVKLTSRGVIEERERTPGTVLTRLEKLEEEERAKERDRTRVSFVREVEVLKHISHPNITPLLSHLTTRTHHVLVLPYLPGGDLLGLVNDEQAWNQLGESTLQRIFAELCKAVSWLHGVGLVHRDIKLENILLTVSLTPSSSRVEQPNSGSTVVSAGPILAENVTSTSPTSYAFPSSSPSASVPASPTSNSHDSSIPPPPAANAQTTLPTPLQPLIKLTDFGLSRFIDPANPLLTTRCGSEAYAAPELVMGGGRAGVASSSKSPWFSEDQEAAGRAPEEESESESSGGYDARETDAWACGVVLYALVARKLPFGEGPGEVLTVGKIAGEGGAAQGFSPMQRRQWLMKIARGEWTWPETDVAAGDGSELCGPALVHSAGAKRAAERLLVRDPSRRARVKDLWSDEWVGGAGVGGASAWGVPSLSYESSRNGVDGLPSGSDAYTSFVHNKMQDGFPPVLSRLPTGLPSAPSLSDNTGLGSVFGTRSAPSDAGSCAGDDEEEFDNDRREKQVDQQAEAADDASLTAGEDEDLEDEEEDGEGWLVDKDGINNIARSEVPR